MQAGVELEVAAREAEALVAQVAGELRPLVPAGVVARLRLQENG